MKLSHHFWLWEFTKSQTAVRLGIDNTPDQGAIDNMRHLSVEVLDKVRQEFGPFTPSSGYRSPALNEAIRGAENSQHMRGEAADIEVSRVRNVDLARWMRQNVKFDQLILEFYDPRDPNAGWVHVSYRQGANRGTVLTAEKIDGGTVYHPGLPTGQPWRPYV